VRLLPLLALLAACAKPSTEEGAASPDALALRYERVMEQERYGELYYLIDPQERELAVWWLAAGAAAHSGFGALAGDEKLIPEYETLAKKHGIEDAVSAKDHRAGRRALADVDHPALLADLVRFFHVHLPGRLDLPRGALEGLSVEGDAAKGRMGGKPVEFVRREAIWFARPPNS
jgi:hypothetical protein